MNPMLKMTGWLMGLGMALILLCGCGTVASTVNSTWMQPVPEGGDLYHLNRVSIHSPDGTPWTQYTEYVGESPHLVFLRRGVPAPHHYMADVAEMQVSPDIDSMAEIKEHVVKEALEEYAPGRNIEVTKTRFKKKERYGVPGMDCRIESKAFDAPDKGDADYLSVITIAHVFAHPDVPGLYILVAYQERTHADQFDTDTQQQADQFFSGLEFREPPEEK